MVSEEEAKTLPNYVLKGSMIHFDIFEYDRTGYGRVKAGEIDVNRLDGTGMRNRTGLGKNSIHFNANISPETTFVNHSVIYYLDNLTDEALQSLKEQLKIE